MRILGLDLATTCGACIDGPAAGGPPVFATLNGPTAMGGDNGPLFGQFRRWLGDLIAVHGPGCIVYEAPWVKPGDVGDKIAILFGLPAHVDEMAHTAGIECWTANIQTVRRHFVDHGRPQHPKAAVMARCRMLGWRPRNEHEADAAAVWSFAKSVKDRKWRAADMPMFANGAS